MAIPSSATVLPDTFDTKDRTNYLLSFEPLLQPGEIITSASIALFAEAAVMGLTILEDANHGPWIANDTCIEVWFEFEAGMQEHAAFDAIVSLPISITIITSGQIVGGETLPRRFQRTVVLKATQL